MIVVYLHTQVHIFNVVPIDPTYSFIKKVLIHNFMHDAAWHGDGNVNVTILLHDRRA